MTNGDWIRGLSDDDLAGYLLHSNTSMCCRPDRYECDDLGCTHCILEWLKKEHEDD
jgi:hypothetical protein